MMRARSIIYKDVVQTVILYRSNVWVITGAMLKLLELFHHWIMRKIKGKTDQSVCEEGW